MKLMIASDIHGSARWCERMLAAWRREAPDRLVLLGDLLYHGPRNDLPEGYAPKEVIALLSAYKDGIICVRGNCDAEVDQMVLPFSIMDEHCEMAVDGRLWHLSHGHRAGCNPTEGEFPKLPAGSVLLTGHTHIPTLTVTEDGVLLLNPGSTSIPKGGYRASCALYRDGRFSILTLDGKTVVQTEL